MRPAVAELNGWDCLRSRLEAYVALRKAGSVPCPRSLVVVVRSADRHAPRRAQGALPVTAVLGSVRVWVHTALQQRPGDAVAYHSWLRDTFMLAHPTVVSPFGAFLGVFREVHRPVP